jgi:hypothetical protein
LFGTKAQKTLAEEMDVEVFVRYDPEIRKVISIEFLNFDECITNTLPCPCFPKILLKKMGMISFAIFIDNILFIMVKIVRY